MQTILVIEDNKDIRENTCELLELEGYRVFAADNGKTGLDMVKGIRPNIIFCDVLMPGGDGYEVLLGLNADAELSVIPLIFISASVEKKNIEEGLHLGATGFLKKPFTSEELLESIANCQRQPKSKVY